jgi:trk system potassium uptake protein TrkA
MTEDLRVVIAGGGRVGFQTAAFLDDRGHDVMIVEADQAVCDRISDAYIATVIQGDATRPSIIEQTNLESADVVAGLTGKPGANLAFCMEADRMADGLRTVARIESATADEYAGRDFVDAVVFPERAGARVAANEIVGSDVQTLADVTGTLDIMQIRVAEGAPAAGRPLTEVRFPSGTLVVSDDDGSRVARPDTVLEAGKRYVVAVEPDVADEVMNLLRG